MYYEKVKFSITFYIIKWGRRVIKRVSVFGSPWYNSGPIGGLKDLNLMERKILRYLGRQLYH